ncbi:hypothetical protein CCP3SC1_2360002 [Gammaproteobacteria bacterium]
MMISRRGRLGVGTITPQGALDITSFTTSQNTPTSMNVIIDDNIPALGVAIQNNKTSGAWSRGFALHDTNNLIHIRYGAYEGNLQLRHIGIKTLT